MIKMADINYYLGCFLLVVMIISVIILIHYFKKMVDNQKVIMDELNCLNYGQNLIKERLYNINNDVYDIKRSRNGN